MIANAKNDVLNGKCIKTKAEVLDFIKNKLVELLDKTAKNDTTRPVAFYEKVKELLTNFEKDIMSKVLPDLLPPWTYKIDLCDIGLKLSISKLDIIKTDDISAPYMPVFEEDAEYIVIVTRCKMFSLKDFATEIKLNEAATLQQIRRGNIPSAIKNGNYWFIPEFAKYNMSEREEKEYYWNSNNVLFTDEFSKLRNCNRVKITKIKNVRNKYLINYYYKNEKHVITPVGEPEEMMNKEKEILETMLISNRDISNESTIIYLLAPNF